MSNDEKDKRPKGRPRRQDRDQDKVREIAFSAGQSDGQWKLLPPAPHVCQECARDHAMGLPHDQTSLYWQYKFRLEHERFPTWADAWAHCKPEVIEQWRAAMNALGIGEA